jgi:hypothetical protein
MLLGLFQPGMKLKKMGTLLYCNIGAYSRTRTSALRDEESCRRPCWFNLDWPADPATIGTSLYAWKGDVRTYNIMSSQ